MTKKKVVPAKKAPAKKAAPAKKVPAKKAPAKRRWTAVQPAQPKPAETKATEAKNPWGEAAAKLDAIGEAEVFAAITNGTMLADIATKAVVSSGSLLTWLNATPERSARAREARKLGAAVLEEQAQTAIQGASDNFQLAKARELAHHLRWKASKLDPRGFGDKLALGAAADLPPLPTPSQTTNVSMTLEVAPGEAYAAMLQRKKA